MQSTGEFNRVTLATGSTVNSASNTYTFTFNASSPLQDGNRIYIKVPDAITPPTSPTCRGITALATSLSCNTLNKEIYVTLSFSSGSKLDPNSNFSFSISTFKNPSSTKPTDGLIFEAQDSTGALINSYTSALAVTVITNTPTTITTASITNDNKNALQKATFNITFTTVNQIPINGTITITYPSEVEPYDNTVSILTCSLNIATAPTCTHDSTNRLITITNIVTTTSLVANTNIQITLNEMKNPELASGTSSFIIQTYEVSSGNNYLIDRVNTGLTLTVNCDYPCLA